MLETAPDASFDAMKKLQADVSSIFQQDKEVTGVTSVLGVGPLNPTTNVGHFSITLRDRDDRADSADVIADRLKARGGEAGGREALYRAGAGHSDHDAHEPLAISIHHHDGETTRTC